MPGWYIHMEAAKQTVDRLRAGNVPPDFPGGAARAKQLGDMAYKWRNYLAAGALGPDIFFLLPDFHCNTGDVLLTVLKWIREVYEVLDSDFLRQWEKWAQPAIDGVGDILNQISGGTLAELGQAMQELSASMMNAWLDLAAELWDWFGVLSSGVPRGYADNNFFWSDMFHYRKTYAFASQLFQDAAASPAASEQLQAFALGWISHCATDVTGHPFVNAKSGGPYRLHWQRHHLIENHMDAVVYDAQHGGVEPYGELDTSALHFRIAFRTRHDAPYNGADDAPAYNYFTGFPPYNTSNTANANFQRKKFWDVDTADLPDELCNLIIATMEKVYADNPKILLDDPQEFRTGASGRPSVKALQDTYWALYHYVKFSTTGGYSPAHPTPPSVINDHSPPYPPGSDAGASDDQTRGGLPDDDSFSWLDLLFAIFGFILYIGELGVWLATLPAAVLADLLTYPARELLYELAVVPLWSLYMATRRPLVLEGFLHPKHEEIERGLVELGAPGPGTAFDELLAALNAPDGSAPPGPLVEPSGRSAPNQAYGADRAFPRAIIQDDMGVIAQLVKYLIADPFCGAPTQPSEFLRPWKYPERNNAGVRNGWEAALTHPGPWLRGQDATALMGTAPGDATARASFESAADPAATEQACQAHLPFGRHLGDPVDYGVYLAGRLSSGTALPDFNLDADRGYGYRAWDWYRNPAITLVPRVLGDPTSDAKFSFNQPCTIPEGFCEGTPSPKYDPNLELSIHYDAKDPRCVPIQKVTPAEIDQAGLPPTGGPHR